MINIIKEGAMVTIKLETGKEFKVNLEEGEIISFTGRPIQKISSSYLRDCEVQDEYLFFINYLKRTRDLKTRVKELSILETYWQVIDMVEELPTKKCPPGYIKYVKNNNEKINNFSLYSFEVEKKFNNLGENDKKTFQYIKEYCYLNKGNLFNLYKKITKLSLKKLKLFLKIFRNSKYCWNLKEMIEVFLELCELSFFKNSWENYVDTNRGFEKNIEILKTLMKTEEQKEIMSIEEKIRHIESIESDNYIVIVPKLIDDLIDEGKQQNNCVGYYYNENLRNGKDAIYFIRRKKNPKKSNTTCRYNFKMERTIESRIINNRDISDPEILELIEKIDRIINRSLNEI